MIFKKVKSFSNNNNMMWKMLQLHDNRSNLPLFSSEYSLFYKKALHCYYSFQQKRMLKNFKIKLFTIYINNITPFRYGNYSKKFMSARKMMFLSV